MSAIPKAVWVFIALVVVAIILLATGVINFKSSDAEILTFKLGGYGGYVDRTKKTVEVEVPFATGLKNLKVEYTLSADATCPIVSGKGYDFLSGSKTVAVTAENGDTQDWDITLTEAPNSETEIISFSLSEQTKSAAISTTNRTVNIEVKYGMDLLKKLAPNFTLSEQATSFPPSGASVDFSFGSAIFKVTAGDGKITHDWKVNVTVAEPNTEAEILDFDFNTRKSIKIDSTLVNVVMEYAHYAFRDFDELFEKYVKLSPGASIAPADTNAVDFSKGPVIYKVTSQDGKTVKEWTIFVYYPVVVDIEKATIGKGEGVEHAFIRQLKDNPVAWGYTGSLSDSAAVKKWTGGEAHRIAIRTGFVDYKTGKEIRVSKMGVVYLLGKNGEGKTTVTEYAEAPKDDTVEPTDVNIAADSYCEARFAGANEETIKEHVQKYEYVYTPCQGEKVTKDFSPGDDSERDSGEKDSGGEILSIGERFPVQVFPSFPSLE